ncbi:hypothetical protein GWK47_045445 [Chionoecetes opilio]|uniref:Uncharacterized protein n=1 Tax=Chionoecetes opilio TaxID=41210 RepID=A0A8J4YDX1_CHIOP|nr:hypothetical protein GWK47_045445 [Chionoecetes opilio]
MKSRGTRQTNKPPIITSSCGNTAPFSPQKNSFRLFEALDIKTDFLSANPRKWQEEESYVEACRRIEGLRVVNAQPSEEWRHPVLQPRLTKDEEKRRFLPKLWRPIAIKSPGPRRVPFPGQARPQ